MVEETPSEVLDAMEQEITDAYIRDEIIDELANLRGDQLEIILEHIEELKKENLRR